MANVFEEGTAELMVALSEEANVTIVYHRGASFVTIVGMWAGQTRFRVDEQGNTRLIYSDRDYIIPVERLVLGGVKVVPLENDWIEQVFPVPDGTKQFRVAAPAGEPVWRYSGTERMMYRVHCKKHDKVS